LGQAHPYCICGFHATNLTLFSKFMHRAFGLTRKNHFGAKSVPKTVPEIFGTNSSKNRGTKTHITH
ncbi:hypothetical protein, partial [Paramuribaculum intestinale]|uniref:hypothetical protein n=1 Tax=Paramuribaculum intestinale TaxID=2094151 RepID=UPI0025B34DF4